MIGKKNVYLADFVHFLPTAYFVFFVPLKIVPSQTNFE